MAADTFDEDLGGGRRGSTRKRLSGKKLMLFVILPVLLAIVAAGGLWYLGVFGALTGGGEKAAGAEPAAAAGPATTGPYFWPAKPMELLVNLRTDSPRPSFLKLSVSLELEHPEDGVKIGDVMPRVTDTLQVYLRELRADQLQGSAGLLRVREELLARINAAVRPVRVKDVLFNEMLIQ